MKRFAFIFHPIEAHDVTKKFPWMAKWPSWLIETIMKRVPPFKVAHVTGLKSDHGETEGWFIALTLSSRQMLELPERYVMGKIIKACQLAEKLGADIVGLGALTSVVGDAGVTASKHVNIAVTTGNSYTVETSLVGAKRAAGLMGHDLKTASVAIVGATGAIGSACARILARDAGDLTLVSRSEDKLLGLSERILGETGLACRISTDVESVLLRSDIVLTVSGAATPLVQPEFIKKGAVVCDVARPRDVSARVKQERNDVLVIDGGVVSVPGENVQLNFRLGLPQNQVLACMAETMMLAMDGRCESFTLGRDLKVEQIDEIEAIAGKHGFSVASLRSFERALTDDHVAQIRANAGIEPAVVEG